MKCDQFGMRGGVIPQAHKPPSRINAPKRVRPTTKERNRIIYVLLAARHAQSSNSNRTAGLKRSTVETKPCNTCIS